MHGLFVCFVALRAKLTAMVMAGRSATFLKFYTFFENSVDSNQLGFSGSTLFFMHMMNEYLSI